MPLSSFYIAFDLETTGLSAQNDRVVEIGAVRFDAQGRVVDRFERLINPQQPISPSARAVNGLLESEVAEAPVAALVLPEFLAFLDKSPDSPLIAHNAAFDASFLGRELSRAAMRLPSCPVHDTLALARRKLPHLRSHRLDTLVTHFGIADKARHRALSDSLLVKDLWLKLEGPGTPSELLTSYPIYDPNKALRPPNGWERLDSAVNAGCLVRIVYDGGTRGSKHREITPRRFVRKGGITYVVALCHIGSIEKSFRLDRIRDYEVVRPLGAESLDIAGEPVNRYIEG